MLPMCAICVLREPSSLPEPRGESKQQDPDLHEVSHLPKKDAPMPGRRSNICDDTETERRER